MKKDEIEKLVRQLIAEFLTKPETIFKRNIRLEKQESWLEHKIVTTLDEKMKYRDDNLEKRIGELESMVEIDNKTQSRFKMTFDRLEERIAELDMRLAIIKESIGNAEIETEMKTKINELCEFNRLHQIHTHARIIPDVKPLGEQEEEPDDLENRIEQHDENKLNEGWNEAVAEFKEWVISTKSALIYVDTLNKKLSSMEKK